jgi:hypothetical protein
VNPTVPARGDDVHRANHLEPLIRHRGSDQGLLFLSNEPAYPRDDPALLRLWQFKRLCGPQRRSGDWTHYAPSASARRRAVVLDDHRDGISALGLQQGLFSDPRKSDGRFQGAMANKARELARVRFALNQCAYRPKGFQYSRAGPLARSWTALVGLMRFPPWLPTGAASNIAGNVLLLSQVDQSRDHARKKFHAIRRCADLGAANQSHWDRETGNNAAYQPRESNASG